MLVIGPFVSWGSALLIYGFGELVENSFKISMSDKIIDNCNNDEQLNIEEDSVNVAKSDECPCCFSKINVTDTECPNCGHKLI